MNSDDPPRPKRGAGPPSQGTGADTERIEHPFGISEPVNGPIAWEETIPATPIPFDWSAVERAIDGTCAADEPFDYAKRYVGLVSFIRDLAEEAPQPGCLPSLRGSACNWMASCYVLQLPFIEGKSLRECAAAVGCSHEYFRHFVHHWAEKHRRPLPFTKAPETGKKIADALTGKKRKPKEAA